MAYKQPSSGPFKMMGSSPLRQDVVPKTSKDPKFKTYQATLDAVTAGMTDQELRDMAKSQHIDVATGMPSGQSKWNISYGTLIRQRNLQKKRVASSKTVEPVEEKVVEPPVVEEKVTPPVVEKNAPRRYLRSRPETHVAPTAITKVGDW